MTRAEALRRQRFEAGDKVRFQYPIGKGPTATRHGIVHSVDGEYVNIVCRVGRHTFLAERYRSEIQAIVSRGNAVPKTDD